jgi:phosphate:Na+ symporter
VFWGNVGCSLIVFASMLSLKVFALIVLGVTALGLTFHIPKRLVHSYGAIFGMAMIMYGLYLVKDGAAGIASGGWVPDFIEALRGTYLLSFTAGLILTLMIQSNLAVMMIAIALASSQLLSLQETAMVMYGAQAGTGILTYIFSFHAHGRARQVVAYQIAFDLVATLSFVGLFIVELALGVPLLLAAIEAGFEQVSTQVIVLALAFQTLSALFLVALRKWIYPKIEGLFPPSTSESLAEPEFVHANAATTPELGMMLIEKEQRQLLQRLPLYIEYARKGSDKTELVSPANYHAAFVTLSGLINQTLSAISQHNLNQTLAESLISITKIQEQLVSLEGYVFQITEQVQAYQETDRASDLGRNMLESVDFLVLSAIDALESGD